LTLISPMHQRHVARHDWLMLIHIRSSAAISSRGSHPLILNGRLYPVAFVTGRSDCKLTALGNTDDPALADVVSTLAKAGAAATNPVLRMKVRRFMLM
jgi:hypothetical protein